MPLDVANLVEHRISEPQVQDWRRLPPEVVVHSPLSAQGIDYEAFTGRSVGTRMIDIRARVTGYLDKINFK